MRARELGRHWRSPLPLLLASCAVEPPVTAERSDQIVSDARPSRRPPGRSRRPRPTTRHRSRHDAIRPRPIPTIRTTHERPRRASRRTRSTPTAINFGSNKTPHEYDDFLLAVMTDLDRGGSTEYPALYGGAFESLSRRRLRRVSGAPRRPARAAASRAPPTTTCSSSSRSTAVRATSSSTTTATTACSHSSPPSTGPARSASCSPTSSATPSRPGPASSTVHCRPSTPSSRPTASPAPGRHG